MNENAMISSSMPSTSWTQHEQHDRHHNRNTMNTTINNTFLNWRSATQRIYGRRTASPFTPQQRTAQHSRHRVLTTSSTPYTTTSSDVHNRGTVVMSVVEGRGLAMGEIGLAAIDLRSAVLVLSQFADTSLYECLSTKCHIYRPVEVIIPDSISTELNGNRLHKTLVNQFPSVRVTPVERKYFNEKRGLEVISELCCEEYLGVNIELEAKYYCLSATSALLKYIEYIENIQYAPNSLKVVYEGSTNTMTIDPTTAKLLELIVNLNDSKSNESLFGVINHTKTRSGFRLLRSNILQPSTDLELIQTRLDIVQQIINSPTIFDNLELVLKQFGSVDIEHLLSLIVQIPKQEDLKCAEHKIENIIYLKHILTLVDSLKLVISGDENRVFHKYLTQLNDNRFGVLTQLIDNVINKDCKFTKGALNVKMHKCFAIKQGVNGLLDVARVAYSEGIDDIEAIINQLSSQHSIPLKVAYTSARGFHVQFNCGKNFKTALPPYFLRVSKSKNTINFTTHEIIKRNTRINSATEEIYLISNSIISELLKEIRSYMGCLYNLADIVSNLDLLFSFAYQCTISDYVRPDFSDSLAIRNGKHPILDKTRNETTVGNNSFLTEDNNFMVITGPNMSGKSTYLKQVALLQVMSQIGSYVCAEFASFRLMDRLFARVGSNDDIQTNCSTFMLEMKEMSYILKNMTPNTLVIIDELGRGTSTEEGVGICWAICEQLLSNKLFTLLATHFIELTKLENYYYNVSNYSFQVQHIETGENGNTYSIHFPHVIEYGATTEKFYGLKLAEISSLNKTIVDSAKHIAKDLLDKQNDGLLCPSDAITNKAMYKMASLLFRMKKNGETVDKQTLIDLREMYNNEIQQSLPSTTSTHRNNEHTE